MGFSGLLLVCNLDMTMSPIRPYRIYSIREVRHTRPFNLRGRTRDTVSTENVLHEYYKIDKEKL